MNGTQKDLDFLFVPLPPFIVHFLRSPQSQDFGVLTSRLAHTFLFPLDTCKLTVFNIAVYWHLCLLFPHCHAGDFYNHLSGFLIDFFLESLYWLFNYSKNWGKKGDMLYASIS